MDSEDLEKEVDKAIEEDFILLIHAAIKNLVTKSASPFLLFIIYETIGWFVNRTATNDFMLIVFVSIGSIIFIMIYALANIHLLFKFPSKPLRRFLVNIISRNSLYFIGIIWCFFLYLIFYKGLWSLVSLKNGFSFYPLIKQVVFTVTGGIGFMSFNHLYGICDMIGKKKPYSNMMEYIFKYNLIKGIYPESNASDS